MSENSVPDNKKAEHTNPERKKLERMEQVANQIFKLNGLLQDEGERMTAGTRVTPSRWRVLGTLTRNQGTLTVPQLGREMGQARQNVQRLVDAMAKDGLVEFQVNPAHIKSHNVVLTALGQRTYAELVSRRDESIYSMGQPLQVDELDSALAFLHKLAHILEARSAE
jgi:DNA-binding MarR family transcriptional regulator